MRDLGGLRTPRGLTRRGVLIRASTLGALTAEEGVAARGAGVRTVIDLRWPSEVASKPSPYAAGAAYRNVPVDAPRRMDVPGHAAAGTLPDLLRIMARRESGLRDAIEAIAESEPAIVLHCAAGRDRTGFIVAVTLSSIGVLDEDVAADHCESDVELEVEYARLRRENPSEGERLAAVVATRHESVLALLAAIRAEYGDARAYLRAVGVSVSSTDRLRDLLT